ncbi:hypothetical protein JCM8208_000425 [Rhodotorula glutinis]
MSFDPRPRPDTVHLALSDPDLTDTYRDDHSSNPASSPRVRHPRGDTPLSRRSQATSPGRWSVSRRSASDAHDDRGQDADLRELSNLDKLLDLLDGDDDHDQTWDTAHRTMALSRSVAMSTPPPASSSQPSTSRRPPPPPSTVRKHASSAPRPPPSSYQPAHYPASDTIVPETVASPLAPPSTRPLRPPLSGRTPSAVELLQRANGFSAPRPGIDGAMLPDSPSPRPGSVAALRRSEADRSGASALDASWLRARERGYDDEGDSGLERTGAAVDGSYEETVASVDSITRVAEAALKEFDTIVSHHSSPGRPASRMRNIPSPSQSATASTFADPAAPPSSAPPHQQQQHHHTQDDDHHPRDINLQLVQELRDAQDYIAYLQNELHAITDVVQQLREAPETSPHVLEQYPSALPQQHRARPQLSEREQVEQTAQAAFEVVKHTLSMLPSLPSSLSPSSPSPSPSPGPSLLSLHRALAFTRSVDQLAHRTRDPRRDEDVFGEDNLRRVLGLVGEWAARDEASRAR